MNKRGGDMRPFSSDWFLHYFGICIRKVPEKLPLTRARSLPVDVIFAGEPRELTDKEMDQIERVIRLTTEAETKRPVAGRPHQRTNQPGF